MNPEVNSANQHLSVIEHTRCWIERFVLHHNLCPFAHKPVRDGLVRYVVSDAIKPFFVLEDLDVELQRLRDTSAQELETTVLILPSVLRDFRAYNDFLDIADELLAEQGYEGELQIASFHPDYQFADTAFDDPENYTNRAPYPILHLLREASLEEAISAHPDVDRIPEKNIETMNAVGVKAIQAQLTECETKVHG